MPLWADILIWIVALILVAPVVFPVPWLDNRPFFRRTPSKAFRWFLVVVFLVLALSFVIYQCGRHIQVY
jgi:membrane protease YdiL (CAAX protease family)